MSQFILSISINGSSPIDCLPMFSTETGLGLNAQGITWLERSDVRLSRDENNEVTMTANCDNVKLIRKGRTLNLCTGRTVRILAQDTILVGATSFVIESVSSCKQSLLRRINFRSLSQKAMRTLAAGLLIGMCAGCTDDEAENPGTKGTGTDVDIEENAGAPNTENHDHVNTDPTAGAPMPPDDNDDDDNNNKDDNNDNVDDDNNNKDDNNDNVDVDHLGGDVAWEPEDEDEDGGTDDDNASDGDGDGNGDNHDNVDVEPLAGEIAMPDDYDDNQSGSDNQEP